MNIPSYERKVNRAERHFHEVERIVDSYSQRRPYTVNHRIEGNGNMHVYRLKILRQPPPRLPLIVGDLVHNLRSALDHVASNVSKSRGSSFPLSEFDLWPDDPSTIVEQERLERERAQWGRLVKGLGDDAVALFKKYMPGQNRPAKSEYFNGLGALAYLSNADKHRELVVLKGAVENPVMTISEFGIETYEPLSGVFEDNSMIFTQTREVKVEIHGPSSILVGVRGGKDVELVRYLRIMLNHIRNDVIPDFVPFMRGDG